MLGLSVRTWINRIFPTKDASGKPNGRIIRVWEDGECVVGYGPKQVYVTTVLPGMTKGPHLHLKRDSCFCCIRGTIRITFRLGLTPGGVTYETVTSGVGVASEVPMAVYVPAGTPCQLYNPGGEEALVINVSSGRYDPSDETEVADWSPNHAV